MKLSLRARLVLILLGCLAVTTASTIVWTSMLARSELAEVYDRNMQQLAWSLDAQYDPKIAPAASKAVDHPPSKDPDSDFIAQIRSPEGKLLYTARPELAFPALANAGFGYTDYGGQRWRYYVYRGPDLQVQIYQPDAPRRQTIFEILKRFLVPSLLQLPILGVVIWFSVQFGLRPLSRLTRDIETRGSGHMSPLSAEDLPADIRPLGVALNSLLARLDSALTMQRRFTADAAHELRTPLAAVQIQLDMVKRARNRGEREAALGALTEGTRRSTHVVRQLLQLARQEPDALHPEPGTVDLNPLLADVVARLRPQADQKSIDFGLRVESPVSLIRGAANDLEVLFENLIDNALRYTPAGGTVEVTCRADANAVTVGVRDNGPGILAAHRDKVFDRFYRVESGKTTGTGLGLAIARTIAERHNARITLGEGLGAAGAGLGVVVTFGKA